KCFRIANMMRTVVTTHSSAGSSASHGRPSMRPLVDEASIHALARALGRVVRGPVRMYLTGGSTAVVEGWRESTADVDLRFEPEDDRLLRELPALKESLG